MLITFIFVYIIKLEIIYDTDKLNAIFNIIIRNLNTRNLNTS